MRAPTPPTAPDGLPADQRFAKLTATELMAELHHQRGQVAKGFYAMGLLLRELSLPQRYQVELGFATFEDLLAQRHMTNRMTALKYIAVVTILDEIIATELGIERSYALVRYASAKSKAEDAPQLFHQNPVIDGESLRDMSSRELLRAARALRAPTTPRAPTDEEHAARRAARALQAALRRSGAKGAVARAQRREGAWIVTVHLTPEGASACASTM